MSSMPEAPRKQPKRRLPVKEAWVTEPNVKECHPNAKWRVRLFRLQMTAKFEIEIGFRTRDGQPGLLRVDNARRSEFDYVRKELESRNARLPTDKRNALDFVRELIRKTPVRPIVACASPGWTPDAAGFVMPYKRYGSAKGQYVWDSNEAPRQFGEIKGDLATYQKTVLTAAAASPHVSLAVMIALAGPLVDYVERKRQVPLLPETAIFHFAAGSSSGKTTLARVAQSVFGSPDIDTDYEASDRGVSERAYQRNNLALIIDDTESSGLGDLETFAKIQKLAQHLPRGRSRAISIRSARTDLPALRWSCNAISTGPETIAEMATRLRRKRQGDRARILYIKLPPPDDGGVFGSRITANRRPAGDSAVLVELLETWLPKCHGVLFDAWIKCLIEIDESSRLIDCVQEFVAATATGANGLEQRFAKKFAILYAAGHVGVESGLLPWPVDWPMRAVRHCYENSLKERDPDFAAATKAVRLLAKSLGSSERFPRFVVQRGRYPVWNDNQMGFRRVNGGRCETFLAKERLDRVCDDFTVESAVFRRLLELKVVNQGTYASASEQLRVRSPEGDIVKIRLWKLDAGRLRQWASLIAPDRTARGGRKVKLNRSRLTSNSSSAARAVKRPQSAMPRR
jgi:Domain of unknown function (DUF927)